MADNPIFRGPFRGINDVISPKHLPIGQFVDALNVANYAGAPGPRPGYTPARTGPFSATPQVLYTGAEVDVTTGAYNCTDGTWVYWINKDDDAIYKCLYDGTGFDTVIGSRTALGPIFHHNGLLYFSDNNVLLRCTVAGADLTTLMDQVAGGNIMGIHYDDANDYIYFVQGWPTNEVKKVDVSGPPTSPVDVLTTGLIDSNGLAAYVAGDAIFVTCGDAGGDYIYKCALDGTGGSQILTGLYDPMGIVHDGNGEILWVEHGTNDRVAKCVDTGGNVNIETLVELGTSHPFYLCIDETTGKLFFDDQTFGAKSIQWLFYSSAGWKIISSFPWRRSVAGVPDGTFSDDIVLLQLLNETLEEIMFAVWFPTTDATYVLTKGYTAAFGDAPAMLVLNDRDADPSIGTDYQAGFGRADFAYMGPGITSAKGGVLMCNGEGAHVFNYVLGDTIYEITASTDGGHIFLTLGNETSAGWDDGPLGGPDMEEEVRDAIIENMPSIDNVKVVISGSPPNRVFTLQFGGRNAGQHLAGLGITTSGGNATAEYTRDGGTEDGHIVYLLQAGLPTPEILTDVGASAGVLIGDFEWKVAFYSSTLGWESPLSPPLQAFMDSEKRQFSWVVPNDGADVNLLFDHTLSCGQLVDYVRLYRRRRGTNTSSPPADGNGTAADDTFYLVDEWPVQHGGDLGDLEGNTTDNVADEARFTNRAPTHSYPPDDAQFVEVLKGRAYFMSVNAGQQRLWWSDLPDPITAELGMVNVNVYSNAVLDNLRASDHHATGLKSLGGMLLALTNRDAFVVNGDMIGLGGDLAARRLPGGAGCASQWCIIETDAMPEMAGSLIYPNDQGHLYLFDGNASTRLSGALGNTVAGLVKKTWFNTEIMEVGSDTWYFASAVLWNDGINQWVIVSTFLDEGEDTQTIECLDTIASNQRFKLILDGETTPNYLYSDSTVSEVKTKLEALPNVDEVVVTKKDDGGYRTFTVTFAGDLAGTDVPLMTVTDAETNGATVTVVEGGTDSPKQLVYDLATGSWFVWDIPGWSFFTLIEWAGSIGKGRQVVVFGDDNANLLKLEAGKGDNGSTFAWYMKTGALDFGSPRLMKSIPIAYFGFDIQSNGGIDAAVTLDAYPDTGAAIPKVFTDVTTLEELEARIDAHCKRIAYRLSGTIEDDQDQPRLVAHESVMEVTDPH